MSNKKQNCPDNFGFVPFPAEVNTNYVTSISKRRGTLNGYADIEITTVDNMFIGSGFSRFMDNRIVNQTQTVIPASSLKGVVRQVARAVSNACIPMDKIDVPVLYNGRPKLIKKHGRLENESTRLPPRVKPKQNRSCNSKTDENGNLNVCIVCDMFGAMSLESKVRFTDLKAEKCSLVKLRVPRQFSPTTASTKYWDLDDSNNAVYFGYKFYYTECEERDLETKETIEAVGKNVTFKGRVFFKDLFEEQLQLLMYSLGVGKYISLKLGGYKADGFGTVITKCTGLIINEKPGNAEDWAAAYAEEHYDDLEEIEDILKYRG